jgi:nitroreductase
MELLRAMRTTPATRRFTADPLPDIVLYRILEHARFAPNGGNRQAWHVIAVRDQEVKNKIADLWAAAWTEDHAFYQAGLVPFVASEAYERNPPGQPSDQPVASPPRASARGRPRHVCRCAARRSRCSCVDLTRVTAMDSGPDASASRRRLGLPVPSHACSGASTASVGDHVGASRRSRR